MKKAVFPLAWAAILLSGCVSGSALDLPDVTPRTFASLPYRNAPGRLCRTPVPGPSGTLVFRTVRALAGQGGRVEKVSIPAGIAFGVWSDRARIAAVRNYLESLSREETVTVRVSLSGVGKKKPYLVRSFPVATYRPFLAAAWADGTSIRSVSAFFVPAGRTVSPVLDLTLSAPGFRSCRTSTPDFPGGDVSFGPGWATVKKGATNLVIRWETINADPAR